ncbi:MAG: hypothetical protein AABX37_02655 [Nanoarchaeota archaeon]
MNKKILVYWIPKVVSVLVLTGFIIIQSLTQTGKLFLSILVSAIILFTILIAWKNPAIGGAIFIILGALSLVVAMGTNAQFIMFSFPIVLSITGSLFIMQHLYQEKKEREEDIEL